MKYRGKKKLFQSARETKEQLANLQSKLEMANTGIDRSNIKNKEFYSKIFLLFQK